MYLDRNSYYLLVAVIFSGMVLVALSCIVCCYCMKEKHVNEDVRVFYFKNIQKDKSIMNDPMSTHLNESIVDPETDRKQLIPKSSSEAPVQIEDIELVVSNFKSKEYAESQRAMMST